MEELNKLRNINKEKCNILSLGLIFLRSTFLL